MFPLKEARPGERPRAEDWNRLAAELLRQGRLTADGATVDDGAGGQSLVIDRTPPGFWARITGEGAGGAAGQYSWVEADEAHDDLTGGRSGTTSNGYAKATNGLEGIAADTIVWLIDGASEVDTGAADGVSLLYWFIPPDGAGGIASIQDAAFGIPGKINTAEQVFGSGDKAVADDFMVGWSTAGDHTLYFAENQAFADNYTYLHAYGTAATSRNLVINGGVDGNELYLWLRAGPDGGDLAFFQFGATGGDATYPPRIRVTTDAFGSTAEGQTTTVAGLEFTSGLLTGGSFTGYAAGGTDVALADGGTGASLADPGADRIMFWDDSAGAVTWLELGSGLSITDTTITATASFGAQSANTVYAGPTGGGAATPSFRSLVTDDLPELHGFTNATPGDADRFPFYKDATGNRDCSASELADYVIAEITAGDLPAASDTAAGVIEIAVQSELETPSSATLAVTPARLQYHPGVAKGWIMFDGTTGTPTVLASHNVSSLTDTAAGRWSVVWDTDFSSANYGVSVASEWDSGTAFYVAGIDGDAAPAAGSLPVANAIVGGGLADARFISVAAYGDQS